MPKQGYSNTIYTEQSIMNDSFDEALGVSMVEIIGADGVLKNPATEETLQAVAGERANIFIVVGAYVYDGNAAPGSATSASVWQISRFDTVNFITTWANGNTNSTNKWTDYLTISYS